MMLFWLFLAVVAIVVLAALLLHDYDLGVERVLVDQPMPFAL